MGVFREGAAQGVFRASADEDVELMVYGAWSLVHGMAVLLERQPQHVARHLRPARQRRAPAGFRHGLKGRSVRANAWVDQLAGRGDHPMFAVDRRTKLLTLGAMCFALFMAMLDNTVVNVALPSIQRHLGSGVSGLQWIIDAYTLVFASLMLTGGTLGDIFGRKRFFLIGLSVFTAGSLLCGLAPSLAVLIAGRAVQGLGAAALLPGTLSILTNTFHDPRERAQAIGIWAGVSGLALALGPLVGGALVDRFGWQSVFFLNVPIGIVALVVALLAVRESRSPEGRRLDLPGQALAIVALGSLTYALIEANNYGWTSPTILGLFVTAAAGRGRLPVGRVPQLEPHAAAQVLPQPHLRGGRRLRRHHQLRHVRHVLLHDAVLPERAGLHALPGRSAHAAGHRHDRDRGAARRAASPGASAPRLPMAVGLAMNAASHAASSRPSTPARATRTSGRRCCWPASAWAW